MKTKLLGGLTCKQTIRYNGRILDITGLNLPLSVPLNFNLEDHNPKMELARTAAEIAQLLDAAQFVNCSQISTEKDDKERAKLTDQAIQCREELIKFAVVMKLVYANPSSEPIRNALASWIASQMSRMGNLFSQFENETPLDTGAGEPVTLPTKVQIRSSVESAKKTEPQLAEALQTGTTSFDLGSIDLRVIASSVNRGDAVKMRPIDRELKAA